MKTCVIKKVSDLKSSDIVLSSMHLVNSVRKMKKFIVVYSVSSIREHLEIIQRLEFREQLYDSQDLPQAVKRDSGS